MKNIIFISVLFLLSSCSKEEFLGRKPNASLVVPKTIKEYQAILDNDIVMNGKGGAAFGTVPLLGEMGSDNYYVLDANYGNFKEQLQRIYIWNVDSYDGEQLLDWDNPYKAVFYANIVMEGLEDLDYNAKEMSDYNLAYGSALFFRSHSFYHLAQIFAPHYEKTMGDHQLGIPLRLTSGFDEEITQSNLNDTYKRMIGDLKLALYYLPTDNTIRTRPSKQAAYGMLSRIYLTIGEYTESKKYADSCLAIQNELLDYSALDASLRYPFPVKNPEVIFSCKMTEVTNGPLWSTRARADSVLYSKYSDNDYRKTLFFRGLSPGVGFKGSYDLNYLFAGIAVDEIYLNRAECKVRLGDIKGGMEDLVHLLSSRFRRGARELGKYYGKEAISKEEALNIVLMERRKQLLFRGIRWSDLRRLNHEGVLLTSLYRKVNGEIYSLQPGDSRWTWPLPKYVFGFNRYQN